MLPRITGKTFTLKVVKFVHAEPMHAWTGGAFVDFLRAMFAGESRGTRADKVID